MTTTDPRVLDWLLDSDPALGLAAMARPRMVIAAGRVYERAALDAMLEAAAAAAKAAK